MINNFENYNFDPEYVDPELCTYCGRRLVDEKMRTKNGCTACDVEYHAKEKEKKDDR